MLIDTIHKFYKMAYKITEKACYELYIFFSKAIYVTIFFLNEKKNMLLNKVLVGMNVVCTYSKFKHISKRIAAFDISDSVEYTHLFFLFVFDSQKNLIKIFAHWIHIV